MLAGVAADAEALQTDRAGVAQLVERLEQAGHVEGAAIQGLAVPPEPERRSSMIMLQGSPAPVTVPPRPTPSGCRGSSCPRAGDDRRR